MNKMQRTAMITEGIRRAVIAHRLRAVLAKDAALAADEEKWITTKKGEKGGGGRRFLIDTETGVILKGGPKRMRGKTFAQAFETKKQKNKRYAANSKKVNEQGRKLVKKLVDKGYLHSNKGAAELKKKLSRRDVDRLKSILKESQQYDRKMKRMAEKEKSMGLLRQIEGK